MATAGTEYLGLLNAICKRIQDAENFEEILWELEQDILAFLCAQRLTIFRLDQRSHRLVSWYKSDNDLEEISVPVDTYSISGFVGLSGQPLRIDNVYDAEELHHIHPDLSFDASFDEQSGTLTRAMICVPIKHRDSTLGVLQVMNRMDGGAFTDDNVIHTLAIANLMGQRLRSTMKSAAGVLGLLVERKRISQDELYELEEKCNGNLNRMIRKLIKLRNLNEEEVGEALERYHKVPFMGYDEEIQPDQELLNAVDRTYLARHCWVPFLGGNGEHIILIDDPGDAERLLEIQQLCGTQHVELRVGFKSDILHYLGYESPDDDDKDLALPELLGKLESDQGAKVASEEDENALDENAGVIVQLVNRLIGDAVRLKASDIHIEPAKGNNAAAVRIRVDGVCRDLLEIPATHIRAVVARIKVLSRLDIAERRRPQDGKMNLKLDGMPVELRVATVPTVNGESAVLRILSTAGAIPLDNLNLLERNRKMLDRVLEKPYGIVLVVGPTGSGKTTTLHGILGALNTRDVKILCAEDPVEITQPGLQQVQVQPKIGLTFAAAMRSFLRADPDVILIGEMRDFETAHTAMEASLTGHLVLSTLHTNSAPETVTRLLEMGLDPLNFSDALLGVLAQRLVRTLCSNCKESYAPDQEELELLVSAYGVEYVSELVPDTSKELRLNRPHGCELCGGTGYKGRTGIHEFLEATKPVKKLVARKASAQEVRELGMREGMRTLRQDGVMKIFRGETTWEMVRSVAAE